jgi:hypothetical protein
LLASTAAFAEPLSKLEESFVAVSAGVLAMSTQCSGYETVPDALGKFAEVGVDGPTYARAIMR